MDGLYVPALQGEQTAPFGPVYPAWQAHDDAEALALAVVVDPLEQDVQTSEPVVVKHKKKSHFLRET
jgi:hypothetical protein